MFGVCLDEGMGLLPPEMMHFLSTLPEGERHPGPLNTIHAAVGPAAAADPSAAPGARTLKAFASHERGLASDGPGDHQQQLKHEPVLLDAVSKNMTVADFLALANRAHASQPVIYLDFLPVLDELSVKERASNRLVMPMDQCWALSMM